MFQVIVHAANEAESYIRKAKEFVRRQFAERDDLRVYVRNADAYNPKQHEPADAIITQPHYGELIANHEQRDVHVIVATEDELDQQLNPKPAKAQKPAKPRDTKEGTPDGNPATGAPAGDGAKTDAPPAGDGKPATDARPPQP